MYSLHSRARVAFHVRFIPVSDPKFLRSLNINETSNSISCSATVWSSQVDPLLPWVSSAESSFNSFGDLKLARMIQYLRNGLSNGQHSMRTLTWCHHILFQDGLEPPLLHVILSSIDFQMFLRMHSEQSFICERMIFIVLEWRCLSPKANYSALETGCFVLFTWLLTYASTIFGLTQVSSSLDGFDSQIDLD